MLPGREIATGLGGPAIASLVDKKQRHTFEQLVLECAFRGSKAVGYTGGFFNGKMKG